MALLPFPPNNITEAIALINQDSQILHEVVHGDETSESLTDNGLIPSVSKAIADLKQRILDNLSPETVVEKKLYSELVGGVFNFTSLSYTPSTDPTKYPINVYINGNLTFDYLQTSPTSITLTVIDAEPDDEVVVTSNLINALATGGTFATKYVTLEQFDADAGTGGDDTVAWLAAINEAISTGKILLLLGKTYLIDPIDYLTPYTGNNYGIVGIGDSVLKARTQNHVIGTVGVLPLTGNNILLENFTIDGFITDDPVDWLTGYNAFQGSRGIVLQNVNNFVIRNVRAQNTVFAGIAGYIVSGGVIENCRTNRTRGNFGDGIYMATATNVYVSNCKVYDHTRIGYVLETPTTQTLSTRDITYINCYAEYGHDSSSLYGGIESNFGFWFENFVNAIVINCHSKNQGRVTGGGFKSVPSFWPNHTPSTFNRLYAGAQYINCVAEDCRYGFSIENIQEEMRNIALLENCQALSVQIGLYLGSRVAVVPSYLQQNQVKVVNFSVFIDDHNEATRAIMQLGGFLDVDGLFVKYDADFNQALWDDEANGYSVVGAFGTDTGFKCTLKNAKVFLNDDTEIPLNTKFRSANTRDTLTLEIIDSWVEQVQVLAKNITYTNCIIETLGQEVGSSTLTYNNCHIKAARPDYLGGGRPVVAYESQTKPVTFKDCMFDLSGTEPVTLYIQDRVKESPAFKLNGCLVRKNFETGGSAFLINAETTLKNNNNGVFNYNVTNTDFENIGGVTNNPIFSSSYAVVDSAKVYGVGNFKSSTLLIDGDANMESNY